MNTSVERGPAKIYQFPVRRRPATPGPSQPDFASTVTSPGVAPTEFGSGWYHDEAIRDEQTKN